MIQPNELMRGNYVTIAGSTKHYIVESIESDFIKFCNPEDKNNWGILSPRDFNGIPITKELLVEKCGFVKPYKHDWVEYPFHFNNAMGIGFNNDGYICVYYEFDADYALPSCGESLVVPLKHIKYLHQVHNLIYLMSGNEMPIKM